MHKYRARLITSTKTDTVVEADGLFQAQALVLDEFFETCKEDERILGLHMKRVIEDGHEVEETELNHYPDTGAMVTIRPGYSFPRDLVDVSNTAYFLFDEINNFAREFTRQDSQKYYVDNELIHKLRGVYSSILDLANMVRYLNDSLDAVKAYHMWPVEY